MKKAAIRFNTDDFIASTLDLSAEEIGALSLLMMLASKLGTLPADQSWLSVRARIRGSKWRSTWKAISIFFEERDGVLVCLKFEEWDRIYRRRFGRTAIPLRVRKQVLDRDGLKCRYCGTTDAPFHFDHVVPLARGGAKDDPENIVVACAPCNLSKGSKLLEEWL